MLKKINNYHLFILILIVFILNTVLFRSIDITKAQWKGPTASPSGQLTNIVVNPLQESLDLGEQSITGDGNIDIDGDISSSGSICNDNGCLGEIDEEVNVIGEVLDSYSEAMKITDNGNVGIGTSSGPGARLEVSYPSENTFANAIGVFEGTTSWVNSQLIISNTDLTTNNYSAIHFRGKDTDSDEGFGVIGMHMSDHTPSHDGNMFFGTVHDNKGYIRMYIKDDGNVGIGTTEPVGTMHILDPKDLEVPERYLPKLTVEAPAHINALFDRTDTQDHLTLTVGSSGTGLHFGDSNRFFIDASPYSEKNTGGLSNELFSILPSGNIGIGTPTPSATLHIASNPPSNSGAPLGDYRGLFIDDDADYIATGNTWGAHLYLDNPVQYSGNPLGRNRWHFNVPNHPDGTIGFNLVETSVADYRFFVEAGTGNIGIGTGQPSAKLDVRGDISATGKMTHSQSQRDAARAACYSALANSSSGNRSLIMVPLPGPDTNLDAECHDKINGGWHAGGVAKSNYWYQDCGNIDNDSYGGGYTAFTEESYFENPNNPNGDGGDGTFPSCGPTNSFICCSPQFPN